MELLVAEFEPNTMVGTKVDHRTDLARKSIVVGVLNLNEAEEFISESIGRFVAIGNFDTGAGDTVFDRFHPLEMGAELAHRWAIRAVLRAGQRLGTVHIDKFHLVFDNSALVEFWIEAVEGNTRRVLSDATPHHAEGPYQALGPAFAFEPNCIAQAIYMLF